MNETSRIAIIGAPGTGKTTLSYKLEKIYNLPICHIDVLYQLPNWVLRDVNERNKMILEEAKKEKWIMDGTFIDTLEERVKVADLIIFLDYRTIIQLKGVFKRLFTNFGKEKPDMPGCKEKFDISFIMYVFTYNKRRRKYLVDILEKYKEKNIIIFKEQSDLDNWIKKSGNSKSM